MQEYGCIVDIADYWADKAEVKHEYNLDLKENYDFDDYQAIIVAVGHKDTEILKYQMIIKLYLISNQY